MNRAVTSVLGDACRKQSVKTGTAVSVGNNDTCLGPEGSRPRIQGAKGTTWVDRYQVAMTRKRSFLQFTMSSSPPRLGA